MDDAIKYVPENIRTLLEIFKRTCGTEGASQDSDSEWRVAGRATRPGPRRPRRGGKKGGGSTIRDWFHLNRRTREHIERIEEDLEAIGLNRRDYVLTNFKGAFVARRESTFNPFQRNPDGRTNLMRMLDGEPPLDREGRAVQLHHSGQRNDGPYIEFTRAEHIQYRHARGASEINRSEHDQFRREYWPQRARDILRP